MYAGLPGFIHDELHGCTYVGFQMGGFVMPDTHVITAWGHNDLDPPTQLIVTDSDDELVAPGDDVRTYNYNNVSNVWHLADYVVYPSDGAQGPYIMNLATLSEALEGPYKEDLSKEFTNNSGRPVTSLRYKLYVGNNVPICTYTMTLTPPKDNKPQVIRHHEVSEGRSFQQYLDVQWVFQTGQFMQPGETVRVDTHIETDAEATFSYEDEELAPASIPAVSEWGVAVMTLLVLCAGTIVLLRRKTAVQVS